MIMVKNMSIYVVGLGMYHQITFLSPASPPALSTNHKQKTQECEICALCGENTVNIVRNIPQLSQYKGHPFIIDL